MTYEGRSGRQFVAVVDTGGMTGSDVSDDEVIAFALPTAAQIKKAVPEPPVGVTDMPRPLGPRGPGGGASPRTPPAGPALELMSQRCTSCHPIAQIFSASRRSRTEWAQTVRLMEERGAELSAQEERVISDYLGRNFGLRDPEDE